MASSENGLIISGIEALYKDALSKGNQKISFTYSRALKSIKACNFRITNGKEALKIDGVGKVIASKIDEILTRNDNNNNNEPCYTQRNFGSVADWLRSLGLECYQEAFVSAGYDNLVACLDLTDEDLDNIKLVTKPGHRKTLLNASKNLSVKSVNMTASTNVASVNNSSSTTSSPSVLVPTETSSKTIYSYKKKVTTSSKIPSSIKKSYPYIPSYRSGSWGILLAIYEAIYVDKYEGVLYKPAIVAKAIKYSDASFSDSVSSMYNAWSGISTLVDHNLVVKEGNPAYYSLTDQGMKLSKLLYDSLSSIKIEKFKDSITDTNSSNTSNSGQEDVILILDNREVKKGENNNLFEALKNKNILCEKRNLELGDITWIFKNRVTNLETMVDIIIERKKIPDLAASIEDGRYKEQKFRLQKCGISRVVYLIEGTSSLSNFDKQIAETDAINNFLLQFTESEEHTVNYLVILTHLIKSSSLNDISSNITYNDFTSQASKSKNLTLSNLFTKQLTLFPGCSSEKASTIVASFPTPFSFQNMLQSCDDVENIPLNIDTGSKKRKLNTNLKQAFYNYYTSSTE